MARSIIATLVGTIIFFAFQALSWSTLFHKDALKPVPANQDSIITELGRNLTEDALYIVPSRPSDVPHEEAQEMYTANNGKPWAIIEYHPAQQPINMGKTMGIAFFLTLIGVAFAVFMIGRARMNSFVSRFMATLGFGIFIIVQGYLIQWNFFQTPMNFLSGMLIDAIIAWSLVGIWLGIYLKPRRTA